VGQVEDFALNTSAETAKGVDTEVRLGFDAGPGRLEGALLWAHLLERSSKAFEGSEVSNQEGTYTFGGEMYAEDKVNYSLTYYWNDFAFGYLGEYISDITSPYTFAQYLPADYGDQKVASQLYHDLVVSYTYGPTNTSVTAGITNITDEAPPFIDSGFNASTDPSTYRMFGIGYYLRLTQKF
jgi:iron complex outermembrane receptor protein